MYSVIAVADAILKIAKRQGKVLTPLQLMKLAYIAHGWSLGLGRGDLFGERIEAWKYGPVVPDLYHATKHFGRNPIPHSVIDAQPMPVDWATSQFLDDIVKKYGGMSGTALSALTHKSGTPWDQVYKDGVFGIEIPDSLIQAHYQQLLHDRRRPAPAQ